MDVGGRKTHDEAGIRDCIAGYAGTSKNRVKEARRVDGRRGIIASMAMSVNICERGTGQEERTSRELCETVMN